MSGKRSRIQNCEEELKWKISVLIVLIGVIGLLIVLFFVFVPVGLWISSLAANVKVSIFNLVGMRLRRVVPSKIVMPLIKATKAGLSVNVNQLEAHVSGRRKH